MLIHKISISTKSPLDNTKVHTFGNKVYHPVHKNLGTPKFLAHFQFFQLRNKAKEAQGAVQIRCHTSFVPTEYNSNCALLYFQVLVK